jgi:hypothetical protein
MDNANLSGTIFQQPRCLGTTINIRRANATKSADETNREQKALNLLHKISHIVVKGAEKLFYIKPASSPQLCLWLSVRDGAACHSQVQETKV